jgi:hypothetical protein
MLRYRLEPPVLEAEFRASTLDRDRRVTLELMLLSIAFNLAAFPADLTLLTEAEPIRVTWTARAIIVVMAAVCAALAWRSEGATSARPEGTVPLRP